ncbi:deoxyhypusine hydroxylase [Cimex lectularius]|uniref:Deoxyhypusine hydroxylase n=1 Tax=Cimex lectularius TaxID=79782 RepID=A0A8I6RVD2_CIMLE|nr:deoxyhypusine hydroxylase [Cimex lectularius]
MSSGQGLVNKVPRVREVLNDPEKSLAERFRALFTLRNIGGPEAVQAIGECFSDSSALLKHELAYCLGQMQDKTAIPILVGVLEDKSENPMVRHEAGEALGAIGCSSVLDLLEEYSKDPQLEIAQTCQLAIERIKGSNEKPNNTNSKYLSVDPAPAESMNDIEKLTETLLNDKENLYKRYKAMFALRNINSEESIIALCQGLKKGSALFRHEIAFVLGQMQEASSVPYLVESLADENENEMVRHECAEALGSIATEDCVEVLRKYLNDKSRVVRESCLVALDIADYEESNDFQYANTALKSRLRI